MHFKKYIIYKMAYFNHQPLCGEELSAAVEFAKSEWQSVVERDYYRKNEEGIPVLVTAMKRSRNDDSADDGTDGEDASKRRKGLDGSRILLEEESMDVENINRHGDKSHTKDDVDDNNNIRHQSSPHNNKKQCEIKNNLTIVVDEFASQHNQASLLNGSLTCTAEEDDAADHGESQLRILEESVEASVTAVISTTSQLAIMTQPLRSILKAYYDEAINKKRMNNCITFATEHQIHWIEGRTDEQIHASNERKRKRMLLHSQTHNDANYYRQSEAMGEHQAPSRTKRVKLEDEHGTSQRHESVNPIISCPRKRMLLHSQTHNDATYYRQSKAIEEHQESARTKRVKLEDEHETSQQHKLVNPIISCPPTDDDVIFEDDGSMEESLIDEKPIINLWHELKDAADHHQQSDESKICGTLNSIVQGPFFTETYVHDIKTQIDARYDANRLQQLKKSSYTLLVMAWALAPLGLQLIECCSSHPKAQALRSGDLCISDITHAFVGLLNADGNEWKVMRKVGENWFEFNPIKQEASPLYALDGLDQCPQANETMPSTVLFVLGELPLQHHIDRVKCLRKAEHP